MIDKLFGFAKPSISSVNFDTQQWNLRVSNDSKREWAHAHGDAVLTQEFFPASPEIPSLGEFALRSYYHNTMRSFAIMKLNVEESTRLPVVELLAKSLWGERVRYTGTLLIPFRHFYYVIRVESADTGALDPREKMVFGQCARSGEITVNANGSAEGWLEGEPNGPVGINLSDREEYDEQFPASPLTLVRRELKAIRRTLKATAEVLDAPRFDE